jgi:tetratricopeptide (TPR) repeat protein
VAIDDRLPAAGAGPATHPGAETIAAYAEARLSRAEAAEVERHLADCADCRDLLSDAAAYLEDAVAGPRALPGPRAPGKRPVLLFAAGLAAAAVIVLAVQGPAWFGRTNGAAELNELRAALASEPARMIAGRLSGDFPYAPPPAVTRGAAAGAVSPDVRIAAARLETAADDLQPADAHRARAIARLATGDFEGAVSSLEAAAGLDSSNADVHNDLAAAYFARAQGSNAVELERARTSAERALEIDREHAGALFNRALILEALGQAEAEAAWRTVREREGESPWGREAAGHAAP